MLASEKSVSNAVIISLTTNRGEGATRLSCYAQNTPSDISQWYFVWVWLDLGKVWYKLYCTVMYGANTSGIILGTIILDSSQRIF